MGLTLRDELLIRSLVQVIGSKTIDRWTFCEDFEADVALCSPNSSLSAVTLRRAELSSTLICISVVHDNDVALAGTQVLRAPVKSAELIALLNDVSNLPTRIRPVESAHGMPEDAQTLADVLYELMQEKSPDLYAVECDGLSIFLVPASRTLYATARPVDAELTQWLAAREVRVRNMGEPSAHHIANDIKNEHDLDVLLWRAGLEHTSNGFPLSLPTSTGFRLRRWPDFGRLRHQAFHLRMAALLSRSKCTVEELATASNQDVKDAFAFVNACAMCDLIVIDATIPTVRPQSSPGRHYSRILNSIRSALGLPV